MDNQWSGFGGVVEVEMEVVVAEQQESRGQENLPGLRADFGHM